MVFVSQLPLVDRQRILQADPLVLEFSATKVLCKPCNSKIKLSTNYGLAKWRNHCQKVHRRSDANAAALEAAALANLTMTPELDSDTSINEPTDGEDELDVIERTTAPPTSSLSAQLAQHLDEETIIDPKIANLRSFVDPMASLPDEIFQGIFRELLNAVEALGTRLSPYPFAAWERIPFVVATVSKRWRSVALDTPDIWSRAVTRFDQTSWDASNATRQLNYSLTRSRQREIVLYLIGEPEDGPKTAWLRENIIRPSFLDRVSEICVDRVRSRHIEALQSYPIPRLRQVSILDVSARRERMFRPLEAFFVSSPMLRSFSFHDFRMDWNRWPQLHSLQTLIINEPPLFSLADLVIVARHAPNLKKLKLWTDKIDDNYDGQPIVFYKLRQVILRTPMSEQLVKALRFPKVEEAALSNRAFDAFEGDATSTLLTDVFATSTSQLRSLEITDIMADVALADAFRDLGSLEDLTLYDSAHGEDFCVQFGQPNPDGRWVLPRLSRLRMIRHGSTSWAWIGAGEKQKLQLSLLGAIERRQVTSRRAPAGESADVATLRVCVVDYIKSFPDTADRLMQAISAT